MNREKKIVLASSSPRRKDILEKMGLEFEIIPSDFEEFLENTEFCIKKIEELAYCKAKDVLKKIKEPSLVIGADTVVVLEGQILGKPKDTKEAAKMLKQLGGKKHSVVTSICIIESITSNKKILSTTSQVEFKNLSDEIIENYIKNYNPIDKAGSYGIQELPEGFVEEIEGSFENIIGLCPKAIQNLLIDFEYVL